MLQRSAISSTIRIDQASLYRMAKKFVLQGSDKDRELTIDYPAELNSEQLDAVLRGDGPCLVLAGAGSGKTRTITYRVAYLIEQGVQPQEILLLTFTNKAAREMLERVERLLGSSIDGVWGGTFHSIANRLLRVYAERLGYTRHFTILDMEDAKGMVKLALKSMKIDPKARRFPSPAVCMNILSYTRNVGGSIQETLEVKYPNFVELEPELDLLAQRYSERKRQANAMDFDDLLLHLLQILEDPVVGPQIASQFRYVLVDEYQDTNAIQARIVNRFASAHGNLFVVGDDAQSIYAFRGANVQNILNFPDEQSSVQVFKLLTNYRSTPEILQLANSSLKQNLDQYQKDLVGLRASGEKPSIVPAASTRQEAQYVAEQVLAVREEGVSLGNIAVLFRATSHSQLLEMELLKRDIPYEYRGGLKLFERAHIKDVLSYLRIHENPKDEAAWTRLLLMQPGIGAVTAEKMAGGLTRADVLQDAFTLAESQPVSAKVKTGWEVLAAILRDVLAEASEPSKMIRAIAASGYQEYLEREYPNWRDRLEDIEQFALFAESYDSLETFLADVSLYDDVLALKEKGKSYDDERIVLSTVHQAKGLEWDTVFILHLADGSFPNRRAMEEEGGIEEERRLFYVAVTRARKSLYLTYPLTMGADTLVLNRPSMFLDELDPRLFERIELVHAPMARAPRVRDSWSWEDGYADDVIELDVHGEPKRGSSHRYIESNSSSTKTAWKSSKSVGSKKLPKSLLSDIEDL
ncbi:AAA family ATPase [Candidatus Uhrbacteria bacterium]|nr:AAA family ATPase [Candidatus Uhrbacteria bacterium]MBD3284499.1 AAA family ATPase [Candidatus Uhrbacteria bacterium]